MRVVYFTHSLMSCWNHGNAHFVRGVLRELIARGHDVVAYEPDGAWSLANLLADAGDAGLRPFREAYPELSSTLYVDVPDLDSLLDGADLVIVHEWNDPDLVAAIGRRRAAGARFTLLFHDTHHRAVSDPEAIHAFDLDGYDGVLAFGETLAAVYRRWGWGDCVFVWHEAADTRLFRPPTEEAERHGLIWIGNWGDDERSVELESFLFRPAQTLGVQLDVYGVRYPSGALQTLQRYRARYHGWSPNAAVPALFGRHVATVHVPRRFYVDSLPGIPTIRMFEALACGIPLISAPWRDIEHLFRVGQDFLMVGDEAEMMQDLRHVLADADLRCSLRASGLETIRTRHTCAHRVDELMAVVQALGVRSPQQPASPAEAKDLVA